MCKEREKSYKMTSNWIVGAPSEIGTRSEALLTKPNSAVAVAFINSCIIFICVHKHI
jgi:hypothetical protein